LDLFLNQLPALLGVVVGAAASYLATSAGQRSQWSRSERVRWEEKRVQVYTDYGYAAKRVYELSKRVAKTRGLPTRAGGSPLESGQDEMRQAADERSQVWEKLLLVGDPGMLDAAGTWHRAVWRMEEFAHGLFSDPDQWRDAVRAADEARSRFYAAARRDLGVTGGLPEQIS
jgi:hypothetical protein